MGGTKEAKNTRLPMFAECFLSSFIALLPFYTFGYERNKRVLVDGGAMLCRGIASPREQITHIIGQK